MAQTSPLDESGSRADLATINDTSLPIGHFRFYFADELWEWSPETAQIHGYHAVEMRPTTDQVMAHKHPEDRDRMAAVLNHVRRTRDALSTRHRIITVQGDIREIVAVGQQLCDRDGSVIGNEGFYVDVTPSQPSPQEADSDREAIVTEKVASIVRNRSAIDEVKGMLMLVYRIDDRRAFELLTWRSQVTNTKLRSLAEQLRKDVGAMDYDRVPPRSVFDQLLLTAHQRLGGAHAAADDARLQPEAQQRPDNSHEEGLPKTVC